MPKTVAFGRRIARVRVIRLAERFYPFGLWGAAQYWFGQSKVGLVENFVDYLVPLALLAVVFVLGFGLTNMMRGGSANLSQRLMRWRVILQFFTLVIVMIAIWLKSR